MKIKNFIYISIFILITFSFFSSTYADDHVKFRLIAGPNAGTVGGEFDAYLQIEITNGTTPRTLGSFQADIYYGSELDPWNLNATTDWVPPSQYAQNAIKNTGYYHIFSTSSGINNDANMDSWYRKSSRLDCN